MVAPGHTVKWLGAVVTAQKDDMAPPKLPRSWSIEGNDDAIMALAMDIVSVLHAGKLLQNIQLVNCCDTATVGGTASTNHIKCE